MADIAFLLLIFFLVTTTIVNDKGILLLLPPLNPDDTTVKKIHDRNLFKIQLNSVNQMLINGDFEEDLRKVRSDVIVFVMNRGKNKNLSDSPKEAVVSIKTNRGTSYERFVEVLNAVQGAYFDIYSDRLNISIEAYRNLNYGKPEERKHIRKAKDGIPMNISIAEPTN